MVLITPGASLVVETVRCANGLPNKINRLDCTYKSAHPAQHLAQWIDCVAQLQIAGGNLVQHRREKKKVVARDERDLHVVAPIEHLLQADGRVVPPKPPPRMRIRLIAIPLGCRQTLPISVDG